MKKKHSKKHELGKTNKMFQKILATISLLLTFGYGTIAQNVTYDSAWFAINGDYNTAIGYGILKSNISGTHNTATGYTALFSNTKGASNVANGLSALYSNTEGSNNTAIGPYALYSNTTGNYNTGIGMDALEFNTTGEYNTALGYYSLAGSTSSSTGNRNTAIGASALQSNSTGMENTALGMRALRDNTTGNSNVANGCYSLLLNTTGYSNTGNGFYALYTNKTGFGNTALGYFADVKSDNLTNATAIGYTAKVAESNTIQLGNNSVVKVYAGTGNNATLIAGGLQITGGTPGVGKVLTSDANGIATWQAPMGGGGSGWSLTGNAGTNPTTNFIGTTDDVDFIFKRGNTKAGSLGITNTFFGLSALSDNTTGNNNTAMGVYALSSNTSGRNNTAVGYDALVDNTTGRNNTALGYSSNVNGPINNATAIGANATVNASNKIRLGDVNVTLVESSGAFMTVSDGRFKTNISEKDVKGLEFIKRLRPVVYNFDTKRFQNFLNQTSENKLSTSTENQDFQISTDIRQSGFIAQEVEKAAEEAGYNFNGIHKPINEKDNYSLGYSQFVVPLVKAVQELNEKNEQLQTQLENILQQLNELKNNQKENTTPSSNLKVYPNPTSDSFTLTATYDLKEARIQLVDMFGNIKNITTQDIDKYSKKIYVKNINTGVYILLITTNTKIEQTEIVIE